MQDTELTPNVEGQVLSAPAMIAIAAITIAGALTQTYAMALVGGLILALSVIARLLARLSLSHIRHDRTASVCAMPLGDVFTLTYTVENQKPLAIARLRVSETLPEGLGLLQRDEFVGELTAHTTISETTSVAPSERIKVHRRIVALQRGRYQLGPTHFDSGDPFGFFRAQAQAKEPKTEILVYPELFPMPAFTLPHRDGEGRNPTPAIWNTDPSRPNGIREYTSGDSLKHFDWKAFARRGAPFVRTYDAERVEQLLIAVEAGTSVTPWRFDAALLESVTSAAGSVAKHCLDQQRSVAFLSNGVPPGASAARELPFGTGMDQLRAILASLACVQSQPVRSLEQMLMEKFRRPPVGATGVVFVCARITPQLVQAALRLRRLRIGVSTLYVGREDAPAESAVLNVQHRSEHFVPARIRRIFDAEASYRPRQEREPLIYA